MERDQNKQTFIDWSYRTKIGPKELKSIKSYASILERIDTIINKNIGVAFFDICSIEQFHSVRTIIESIDNYSTFNSKYQNGIISAALNLYEKYLNQMQISNHPNQNMSRIGSYDSWDIISESVAVKHCDKSFFDYNGSGIPKEVCWFFNVDNLQQGEARNIIIEYCGKEYQSRISIESSDRKRTRVFWGKDLGFEFAQYARQSDSKAQFTKIGKDKYEIRMQGDEKEVSVKDSIDMIKSFIVAKGFTYEDGLIENFWLSLKAKPFLILAGTSGTGKTRLVRLFANAISAEYKLVAVRPDWSDSSDLFGHVDLNGTFVPGEVLDFLNRAKANPEKPFILCLDEMNLARVEYYMSDILSVMETRELNNGVIESDPLLSENYYGKQDRTAREKYGVQRIPENFYIVGTVNMDETTFPFSKKVLDRANTIEFSDVDLNYNFDIAEAEAPVQTLPNAFLKTEYLFLQQCAAEKEYVGKICTELQKINDVLRTANAHVGYRVRDEIVFYMLYNKKAGLLKEEQAFDNEIMQKILPRIQGSSAAVKKLLCDLFVTLEGSYSDSNGSDADNMDTYIKEKNSLLHHPRSAGKISYMTRRFEEDGFTSYWL